MEHALRSVKKDVIIASREQASPLCHSLRRIDQLDMLKIVENMVYPFVEMGGGGGDVHAEVFLGLWCPKFAWLHNGFLRDTFADSHNGSFDFFFPLSLYEEVLKLTKKEKNVCQAFLPPLPSLFGLSVSLSFFASPFSSRRGRSERSSWRM